MLLLAEHACYVAAGCALASSYIQTYAVSKSNFDFQPAFKDSIQQYRDAVCTEGGYDPVALAALAGQAAESYAQAIAKTITDYSTYVCTCCYQNSVALTEIRAAVQAVANATASALVSAGAMVLDCDGVSPLVISSSIASVSLACLFDSNAAVSEHYSSRVILPGPC